jgi:ElaB/YqjD/DUF883 family membrane-anchored ribosome-binding protein
MSLKKEAKAARVKASGTKKINVRKQKSIVQGFTSEKQPVGRNARVLSKAGKVIKVTAKQGMGGGLYDEKAEVKRVDLDAYDILAKRAKAAGLKGKSAEAAISKALKTVSTRMSNDRNRTANRAKAIARREAKKRKNTNLS